MKQKYPRTYHLPFSPGFTNDDKVLNDTTCFKNIEIVATEKMDGENTTISRDYIHARSLDSNNHPSRNWLKSYASTFQYMLEEEYRICGENLYASHSIYYTNLKSYFYAFSVWNNDICLSFDDFTTYCDSLGLIYPTVLYRGIYDDKVLKNLGKQVTSEGKEGFVIRNINSFKFADFPTNVAKFVRKGHVQTDDHWMNKEIIPNKLM